MYTPIWKARQSYVRRLMLSMKKVILGNSTSTSAASSRTRSMWLVMISMKIMTMIRSRKHQICYLLICYWSQDDGNARNIVKCQQGTYNRIPLSSISTRAYLLYTFLTTYMYTVSSAILLFYSLRFLSLWDASCV
jgi:hypothetical protein